MQKRKKSETKKSQKAEAAVKLDTSELARVYGGAGGTKGEIVLIRPISPWSGGLVRPKVNPPLGPVTLPVPRLPVRLS